MPLLIPFFDLTLDLDGVSLSGVIVGTTVSAFGGDASSIVEGITQEVLLVGRISP